MANTVSRAQDLMKAGRASDALDALKGLLASKPNHLAAHMLAAGAFIKLEQPQDALTHLEICAQAVDEAPNPVRARCALAVQFANAGSFDRASRLLNEAQELDPDSIEIAVRRADLWGKQGQWAPALEIYRGVLAELPGHSAVEASAGIAAQHLGDAERAVGHYQRALKGDDRQRFVYNNLLAALVELGRTGEAYDHARQWLGHEPENVEAMAFYSLLAVETGDQDEARRWFDFNKLVKLHHMQAPAGYTSLADFNRALEAHILNYRELKTPPEDHPTWHHPALKIGSHINVGDAVGPVADLEALMHDAVKEYFDSSVGDKHPFLIQRPSRYSIQAWAAVLEGQGNQLPHIHKSGYLSGCYYVTIPDEVSSSSNGANDQPAGGFEMGRPPVEVAMSAEFSTRTIKPQEGLMVLFPAYLYHGTIPFKSNQRRICIAFDVIPERQNE